MNRLAVVRSARAQQAHKVNNRINWLMPLLKTDTDTDTSFKIGPLDAKFYSGQDRHTAHSTQTNDTHIRIRILGLPRASSGRQ